LTRKHPVGERVGKSPELLGRCLLVGSVVLVLVATLWPAESESPATWEQVFCPFCGRAALADALANVVLFLPVGVALALTGWARRGALLFAGGLSLVVELAQFQIPGRDPGLGDVLTNIVGAGLGGALVRLAPRWAWPSAQVAGRLSLLVAILASGVFVLTDVLLTMTLPDTSYFGGSAALQVSNRPLRLGGSTEPRRHFQGRLDEVRIYPAGVDQSRDRE
jgi:VanZ like family